MFAAEGWNIMSTHEQDNDYYENLANELFEGAPPENRYELYSFLPLLIDELSSFEQEVLSLKHRLDASLDEIAERFTGKESVVTQREIDEILDETHDYLRDRIRTEFYSDRNLDE